jgi:hypothetical protein
MWNFELRIFRRKIRYAFSLVHLFFICFFFPGVIVSNRWSLNINSIQWLLKLLVPFLSEKNDCVTGKWRFLPVCGTKLRFCLKEEQAAID